MSNGTSHTNEDSGNKSSQSKDGFSKDILTLVLSCTAIIIGANCFVDESIFFAESWEFLILS